MVQFNESLLHEKCLLDLFSKDRNVTVNIVSITSEYYSIKIIMTITLSPRSLRITLIISQTGQSLVYAQTQTH